MRASLFDPTQDSFFHQPLLRELRHPAVDYCIPWLHKSGLTFDLDQYYETGVDQGEVRSDIVQNVLLGLPVHKCEPKNARDLLELKKQYKGHSPLGTDPRNPGSIDRLWNDLQSGRDRIIDLPISPVPSDAVACYWPFHLDAGRWGIYISVRRVVDYANQLADICASQLGFFGNVESVLRCVLFSIYHHEFFHHIVESTATTLEITSAAFGTPRPLYRECRSHVYEKRLGMHPHYPLEEALANAYAHNSLGFISRMKFGYVAAEARLFQWMLRASWTRQGPGYASAGHYVMEGKGSDGYLSGATQLLAMILNSDAMDPASLMLLAQKVMPRGYTAFAEKARVPTYLIGSADEVEHFLDVVPAVTESYTTLFFHRDTSELDDALLARVRLRNKKASKPVVKRYISA